MKEITVFDVANYFLTRVNEEEGDSISNMKLQKLVYYAQGCYLALNNKPLFVEKIMAWEHGPVVPELWKKYTKFGNNPIPQPEDYKILDIPKDIRNFLDDVWSVYGQYSAWGLRCLTHEEPPWKDTPSNSEITQESMRLFFINQVNA